MARASRSNKASKASSTAGTDGGKGKSKKQTAAAGAKKAANARRTGTTAGRGKKKRNQDVENSPIKSNETEVDPALDSDEEETKKEATTKNKRSLRTRTKKVRYEDDADISDDEEGGKVRKGAKLQFAFRIPINPKSFRAAKYFIAFFSICWISGANPLILCLMCYLLLWCP